MTNVTSKAKTRVLLVDDHSLVRTGLRAIIDSESDMEVVGEARDGLEGLEKVRELRPDIVIMDITMPNLGGLEATRVLKKEAPDVKVIVLTIHESEEMFFRSLEAGAEGYVSKAAPEWELVAAINTVRSGHCYLNPTMTKVMVNMYLEKVRRGEGADPYETLSEREREILALVASGRTSNQIAQMLHLSEHTVHNHRSRLMEKLGVHNRMELLKYAINRGITSDFPPASSPLSLPPQLAGDLPRP